MKYPSAVKYQYFPIIDIYKELQKCLSTREGPQRVDTH